MINMVNKDYLRADRAEALLKNSDAVSTHVSELQQRYGKHSEFYKAIQEAIDAGRKIVIEIKVV